MLSRVLITGDAGTSRPRAECATSYSALRVLAVLGWLSVTRGQLFPAQIDLASLNGTDGFAVWGDMAGDQCGYAVAGAGDLNDDGIDDFAIGAPKADVLNASKPTGRVYVVFGRSGLGGSGTLLLSDLNGTDGFVLSGERALDLCGHAVAGGGDVNGDGIADLLLGSPFANPGATKFGVGTIDAGKGYVVLGARNLGNRGNHSLIDAWTIDGHQQGDQTGHVVAGAGDVNGDGLADFLISAPGAQPLGSSRDVGSTYVVFGSRTPAHLSSAALNGTNGFALHGQQSGVQSGNAISGAGDVNGDGIADLIVGEARGDADARTREVGKAYVYFGKSGHNGPADLVLASFNGTDGFVVQGKTAGDHFGSSASTAGDVNADGIADLIIGANRAASGQACVIFGAPTLGAGGVINVATLNGTRGFVVNGQGNTVAGVGDLNGDGIADIVIGAPQASKTYVVFGRADIGAGGALELASLNGTYGFVLIGEPGSDSGFAVSGAGDINADGATDLLVGGPEVNRAYVLFGRRPPPPPSTASPSTTTPTLSSTGISKSHPSMLTAPVGTSGPVHSSDVSSESMAPVLAIAGGVCAVVSSVTAVALALLCRRKSTRSTETELDIQTATTIYSSVQLPRAQTDDGMYDQGDLVQGQTAATIYSPLQLPKATEDGVAYQQGDLDVG